MTKSQSAFLAKGKRPKGMSYGDYSAAMKKAGKDAVSEDEYNDMEEGDEEKEKMGDATNKSEINADDLRKSLVDYTATEEALGAVGSDRTTFLEERAQAGTITKSEKTELGKLWAVGESDTASDPALAKSLSDRIGEDEMHRDLVNASDVLKSFEAAIGDILSEIGSDVLQGNRDLGRLVKAQGHVITRLSTVSLDLYDMVKSIEHRTTVIESAPTEPRAVQTDKDGVKRPLAKSVVGGDDDAGDDVLTKSMALTGLRGLLVKAHDKGHEQKVAAILFATARVESNHGLPQNLVKAVRAEIAQEAA